MYLAPGPTQHVVVATRPSRGTPFGAPAMVQGLAIGNGNGTSDSRTPSPDELVIVYTNLVGGKRRLYTAVRASASAPFTGVTAVGVAPVAGANDGDAELSRRRLRAVVRVGPRRRLRRVGQHRDPVTARVSARSRRARRP